jgi:hypothetical protein
MKKLLHIFLCLVIVLSLGACGEIVPEIDNDVSLLYGKWQEGSVFERYYESSIERVLANGDTVWVNGTTWDEREDVWEDEAQLFNWTLTGSTLKHEHVGTFVMVPKIYTVTSLTSSELVYEDDYGVAHHFSKVE